MNIIKRISHFLFFAVALAGESKAATAAIANPTEFEEISLAPSRTYGCIHDAGRASLAYLKNTLHIPHLDASHPTMQALLATTLSSSVDLRSGFPAAFNQLNLGSCTSNATIGAVLYERIKQGNAYIANCVEGGSDMLSILFHYYQERVLFGDANTDSGASMSDAVQVLLNTGICHDSSWPYTTTNIANFATPPSPGLTTMDGDAINCKAMPAGSIPTASVDQTLSAIQTILAANVPVIVGIQVYQSFESAAVTSSGIIPMPNTATEKLMGGHAIVLVGYDNSTNTFLMRNSWGTSWGQSGYATIPYDYIINGNLASSFWAIGSITAPATPPAPPPPASSSCCGSCIIS